MSNNDEQINNTPGSNKPLSTGSINSYQQTTDKQPGLIEKLFNNQSKRLDSLQKMVQEVFNQNQQLINQNQQLANQNQQLINQNQQLAHQHQQLINQNQQLANLLDKNTVATLAALSKWQNPINTHAPQRQDAHLQAKPLCDEYRILTEVNFENITEDLLKLPPLSERSDIKANVIRIKAMLSENVFFVKSNHNSENNVTAIAAVIDAICDTLQIAKIDKSTSLYASLKDLVRRGRQLAANIGKTEPPGELVPYKNVNFDGSLHKAMVGYKETGKVVLTIWPAYIIGGRLQEKAFVVTDEKEDWY